MKKFRLIVMAAVLIAGIALMGSCTHKLCPAYAKADTEQTDNSG